MPNMTALGNSRAHFFGMRELPEIVPSASAASQVSYNERIIGNILRDKIVERQKDIAGGLQSIQSVAEISAPSIGTAQSIFK